MNSLLKHKLSTVKQILDDVSRDKKGVSAKDGFLFYEEIESIASDWMTVFKDELLEK